MKYIDKEGDYASAVSELLQTGGQLYASNTPDGANTIVRGSIITTYWKPHSKRRAQVYELAELLSIKPEGQTGGRIARTLIKDFLQVPYKETYFDMRYRELAKSGDHWHYQYAKEGWHGYCIEFDIKSAYISHLLRRGSLLCDGRGREMDDSGAMNSLRTLNPLLPKWFRLQLLGVIASHQRSYFSVDKSSKEPKLNLFTKNEIAYGALFNTVHAAIQDTYKTMEKVHKLAGIYMVRAHTDSFTLLATTPPDVEESIFNFLRDEGLEVAVKGMGNTYLFGLNEGIIGRKYIGAKSEVIESAQRVKYHHVVDEVEESVVERWQHIIEDVEREMRDRKSIPISYEQIPIKVWSSYYDSFPF